MKVYILKKSNGEIYPIEVKSGHRTQAKSLKSYISKYMPTKTIKLIGSESSENDIVWPIYFANFLIELDQCWQ